MPYTPTEDNYVYHVRLRIFFMSVAALLIAAAAWLFNFGWIRFFLTLLLLPVVHSAAFFVLNMFVMTLADKSKKLQILNLCGMISYLMLYIFLPDGGDVGGMYFFFGLIRIQALVYVAELIVTMTFPAHLALVVLQIVEMVRIKKTVNKEDAK